MKSIGTHKPPFFWTSTGKKVLMAVSGLALAGFILAHLAGNLQMFLGQEAVNRYSTFLKSTGELLWVARIGLLTMGVIHVWTAIAVTHDNLRARPIAYATRTYQEASLASRTMIYSGLILLCFLVYHLGHFTLMMTHPEYRQLLDAQGRHDVYSMVVLGFQRPWISAWYVLGVFLLGMHLSHGLYSMFQSLGFQNETLRRKVQPAAAAFGWLIFIGFASIPIGVLTGLIALPSGRILP